MNGTLPQADVVCVLRYEHHLGDLEDEEGAEERRERMQEVGQDLLQERAQDGQGRVKKREEGAADLGWAEAGLGWSGASLGWSGAGRLGVPTSLGWVGASLGELGLAGLVCRPA